MGEMTLRDVSEQLRHRHESPGLDEMLDACADAIDAHLAKTTTVATDVAGRVDADKGLAYLRNFRPIRNALDTFDAGDLQDFEDGFRAALAHPRHAVPELIVPGGWVFISADFSTLASGQTKSGRVLIQRDKAGTTWWHSLTEDQRESTQLYIYGEGETIQSAIDDAVSKIVAAPASGGG
ncbi:hypothetical protein [Luteibacter sp. E-22]|uniref:hypothetical protein n=1 Tax=Luteibacter sp. E-22 TaxID=3404050 RepID=UPI003CF25C23